MHNLREAFLTNNTRQVLAEILPALPEFGVPLLRTRVKPRELIAELLMPMPAISLTVASTAAVASISWFAQHGIEHFAEFNPGTLLLLPVSYYASNGCLQLWNNVNTPKATMPTHLAAD
jgi:hypothetical protein